MWTIGRSGVGDRSGERHGKRFATLKRHNASKLPAADDLIDHAGRTGQEMPSLAKGQLIVMAEHKTVRDVETGRAPLVPPIVKVLRAAASETNNVCKDFRPCIRSQQSEPVRVALLRPQLQRVVDRTAGRRLCINIRKAGERTARRDRTRSGHW